MKSLLLLALLSASAPAPLPRRGQPPTLAPGVYLCVGERGPLWEFRFLPGGGYEASEPGGPVRWRGLWDCRGGTLRGLEYPAAADTDPGVGGTPWSYRPDEGRLRFGPSVYHCRLVQK